MKTVEEYLGELKIELKGCDAALLQDAMADAEEFLRTALLQTAADTPDLPQPEALAAIIQKFGTPQETAAAYRDMESRLSPYFSPPSLRKQQPGWRSFFGSITDARAWGAFLYFLISCLSGSLYGLWALTGASVSLASLVFILGIPISGLFLLSIRGIALAEGRIVEALLGIRMPRRSVFIPAEIGWFDKLKALFIEAHTWRALLYCVMMFPLGWIYFGVFFLMLFFSLAFIFSPILELVFSLPMELFGPEAFTPVWLLPFVSLGGIFLLPLVFHLAKLTGKLHGKLAKSLLVNQPE